MKILSQLLILCFVFFVATACGGDKKGQIAKKWKITDIKNKDMDKMGEEEKKMMKEMLAKSTMEFKKDGSYEMSFMGQSQKGKWELKDDKTISITDEGSKDAQAMKIKEVSDKKLVISDDKGEVEMTLEPA
ncbi:MAG TPA: hypothetical protein DCM08_05945 [Microscillaceae bacterium]|nr:hypothetical protein [Microscillaceae bacterium]